MSCHYRTHNALEATSELGKAGSPVDPASAAILTNLASDLIGWAAGWMVRGVRGWTSDTTRIELLTRRLNESVGLALDSGTVRAFLESSELERALEEDSAADLFQRVAASHTLEQDVAQRAVVMLISTVAMSDDSLAPLFRHRDVMSELESIGLGLGFVFGELLTEILAIRSQGSILPRIAWLESNLAELSERIVLQFQTLGVDREVAISFETDARLGASVEVPDGTAIVVTGPMGSGKSLAALRWTQMALVEALLDPAEPIAILFRARELDDRSLAASIESRTANVGRPRVEGIRVAIDGLDEVRPSEAVRLAAEALSIVRSWPNSSAALFSRPQTLHLSTFINTCEMPTLDDDAIQRLGDRLGVQWLTNGLPDSIRGACHLPLFAILVAVWRRGTTDHVGSRAELFARLLRDRVADSTHDDDLMSLAARSLGRGSVPESELGAERVHRLRSTGLVEQSAGIISFALPIIEQWYAAKALLANCVSIAELLSDPQTVVQWRYPIALAVSLTDADEADRLLLEVLQHGPHLLPWIVKEVEEGWRTNGPSQHSDPAMTSRVQRAGEAIISEILGAQGLVGVLTSPNHEAVVSASTSGTRMDLSVVWRHRTTGHEAGGPGQNSGLDAREKVAPWKGWLDVVKRQIDRLLADRAFPCGDPTFVAELTWAFARVVHGQSGLRHAPLAIDIVLNEARRFLLSVDLDLRTQVHGALHRSISVPRGLFPAMIDHLETLVTGGPLISRPWPEPDNLEVTSGWTDDLWRQDTLCTMMKDVTLEAFNIYEQIAKQWFPRVVEFLPTVMSLPVEVRYRLDEFTPDVTMRIGRWTELWRPLEPGSRSAVLAQLGGPAIASWEDSELDWHRWIELRGPLAGDCRTATSYRVTPQYLLGDRPATAMAYHWLHEDLHELLLVNSRPGNDG